jgi:hypothetical protein
MIKELYYFRKLSLLFRKVILILTGSQMTQKYILERKNYIIVLFIKMLYFLTI